MGAAREAFAIVKLNQAFAQRFSRLSAEGVERLHLVQNVGECQRQFPGEQLLRDERIVRGLRIPALRMTSDVGEEVDQLPAEVGRESAANDA